MADGEDAGRLGASAEVQGRRPRIRARGLAIRRQSVLYTFLVGLGAVLIHLSGLRDLPLVTEGVAFIAIGAVGLIMSWTTQDIGQGIKDAVREDGELTRKELRIMAEAVREVGAGVERVGAGVERVGAGVEAMSKDNREFFRQMLESQNRIQETQSVILKRQNDILDKVS